MQFATQVLPLLTFTVQTSYVLRPTVDKIEMFSMWWQLDCHKGMVREMGYSENSPLGIKCDVFAYF